MLLEISRLNKAFGGLTAISNIAFSVKDGTVSYWELSVPAGLW
jgi:ABC-type branched-subunit amino acid transport system ATPase component